MIRPSHPITHRARQRFLPIRLLHHSLLRCILDNILAEAINMLATVRGGDGGGTIAALFEGDVAVGGMVVGGFELEFGPGGREVSAALDAAFEGGWEGDECRCAVGGESGGFEGVGEVCAGCAVAVPG